MKLNCPACKIPMLVVTTKSHYQIPIELDQCSNCGGIWFDTSELFSAHHKAHLDVPQLNTKHLVEKVSLKSEQLLCPKDKIPLKRFQDPVLPEELILEACPKCHGYFINRSHFESYQGSRTEKLEACSEISDKALAAKLQILLDSQSDVEFNKSLEKIGKILTKPVPFRLFLAYWMFGTSGYVALGLLLVFREMWFGLSGKSFTFNTQHKKNQKLEAITKFILKGK